MAMVWWKRAMNRADARKKPSVSKVMLRLSVCDKPFCDTNQPLPRTMKYL
jgi:hypothetical protein